MKVYKVKIRFVTDYLQARFTEDAKKELENYVSKGIVKSDEDSWKVLLHEDEGGIYVPANQLRQCFVNGGKQLKLKKQRSSMKTWVQSFLSIEPGKIYLNKKEPDEIVVSYPARKDGMRVTIKHPSFTKGTEIEFRVNSLDDKMEDKAIKDLIEVAGKMYGIGARRADMFGRFELVEFK
jgi:hypothetical protein